MPIKAENRARYPAKWPEVRGMILERAGYRCEFPGCTCQQYEPGTWALDRWHPCGAPQATYSAARAIAAEDWAAGFGLPPKPIVIVLTIAHLNHQPEDCDPDNLAAYCQRHHLAHDRQHHLANAQATRRAKSGNLELAL
ncbi:hypothetical protein LJR175_003183 [Variovorax sp. LjRoot175]|uniref:hypothetical protein n=1 Tax=Variovorax sp. LjRoot175 TaxID=3342276 RepID=UPI003ECC45C6